MGSTLKNSESNIGLKTFKCYKKVPAVLKLIYFVILYKGIPQQKSKHQH
jgi:hypothetical protein